MKWKFVFAILGISLALIFLFDKKALLFKRSIPIETSTFFITLPITQFNSAHIPCLNIEIEGKKFTVGLDLGYKCEVHLDTDVLTTIENKSFQRTVTTRGVHGWPSKHSKYKIPLMKMGSLTFRDVTLDERTEQENEEGMIHPGIGISSPPEQGMLGWILFTKSVLFLDLWNSKVIIADSIETFKKYDPSLSAFSKTPLFTQRSMLECEITTSQGPLLCMLDTGSTYNLILARNTEGKSLEELVMEKKNFTTFTTFQIGEKEFGATTFRPFPIAFPVKVEAILGMEFFSHHKVLIDFKNSEIYFAP